MLNCNVPMIATALNPATKSLACLPPSHRDNVWTHLSSLVEAEEYHEANPVAAEHSKKFRYAHSDEEEDDVQDASVSDAQSQNMVDNVIEEYKRISELHDNLDPLKWWRKQSNLDPLKQVARRYLGCPATSVPSERVFSVAGNIVNKRRASLSGENVEMLVCLSSW